MPKILIADDDARIRAVLRQAVAGVASSVSEACDGGEAMALCAQDRPDWVIVDWRLKPAGGLRVTSEIKARFPEMQVVILSQEDDSELRATAARAGVSSFVVKEDLLQVPGILAGGSDH